jgi:putative ABC transport system substrate-binding protein
MPVVGFLCSAPEQGFEQSVSAFRQGLHQAGFDEGRNVTIIYQWAQGDYARLKDYADDLVAKKVDVIASTGGVTPARAAKSATSTIPIVFVCGFDPANPRIGLVKSLSAPGGNATGVNVYNTELLPERRKLFGQLVPAANLALLLNPRIFLAQTGIEQGQVPDIPVLNASTEAELDQRYSEARARSLALIVDADSFFTSRRDLIISLAAKYEVPSCYPWQEYAEAGGLISYGASFTNPYRQIGVYAGLVLGGADPGSLPVLQPSNFELVINLTTARTLGLTVPPALLARADRIIE